MHPSTAAFSALENGHGKIATHAQYRLRSHFLLILAVCLILVFTICAFDLPFYATTIVYPLIYGDSRVYNQTCYESLTMPGDSWDAVLHNTLQPECPDGKTAAIVYPGRNGQQLLRTALTSYPRSGNSYTRSLVERASGFQTSSIYCDRRLLPAFRGECGGFDNPLLIKTHWPFGKPHSSIEHWKNYDRALRLIRNPIDNLWSDFQMAKTGNHSGRIEGFDRFTSEHWEELGGRIEVLLAHARYWDETAQILVKTLRYEDVRINTLNSVMDILSFLLPPEDLPTLEQVTCALDIDTSKDPYASRKSPIFAAWDHYDDETRAFVLEKAKPIWCKFGYDIMLKNIKGIISPVDCKS